MTALIGALRVSLSAETASFEAGMKRSQRQAQTTATSINRSLGTIKAGLTGFASALTVGLLAGAISKALEYAGSLGEVSQQLGVTTRDLQVFRFAAGQVGVSQEQLEIGLSKLTITMGKVAAGATAPAKALASIGISVDQIKGKDTGEVFRIIADGLAKIPDRAQRAAVEVALFGRAGAQLDNLLAGGSTQINELSDAADRLGIVLSDQQIQQADQTADKLAAVKTVLAAQIAGVVADNATSILSLASSLGQLTGAIVQFMGSNPTAALAIIGALAGGRIGGLPGAALGAVGGAIAGSRMADGMADQNTDVRFRMEKTRQAKTAVLNAERGAKRLGTDREVKRTEAELRRQTALLVSATKAATAPKAPPPTGVNIGDFLAPKGAGPKKAKKEKADHSQEDALRDAYQFSNELRRSQMDVLQARRDLAHTAGEQAALDVQMLDLQKQDHDAELAFQVQLYNLTEGKQGLTEEQAKQLQAEYDTTDALKRRAILEEQLQRKEEAVFEAADQQREFSIDALRAAEQAATTQEERRRIQHDILNAEIEQKRLELEHQKQLATRNGATAEEIAVIQGKIDHLSTEQAQGGAAIDRNTQGPLAQWAAEVPKTAAEINEAFESIAARGLDRLSDTLTDILMGTKSLKDGFRELASSVLADLIKMTIKMVIFRTLFGGGFAGGGMVGGGGSSIGGLGDYASGVLSGSIRPNGAYASGGFVSGSGTATSDSIPALLSNGEFVVNAKSTRQFLPLLKQLNAGHLRLAAGGLVIPRANMNERINIANDDHGGAMPPMKFEFHSDFRGADPSAVAAIKARQDQFEAELPGRVVEAYVDARTRRVIR